MAYNLKDEAEVKEYVHNLGVEYKFGCYHEHKADVCHLLGDYLEAIKKEFEKACIVYKSNCDDYNYAKSCQKFGNYSLLGKGMKKANVDQAYKYYLKACELGDSSGCMNAGLMNVGKGPHCREENDYNLGMTLLKKCCDAKNSYCCFFLSGMYISGVKEIGMLKDMTKAYDYALKGCELGEMLSCVNVSQMYKKGDGVEKNEELAEKFKKIAKEMQDEVIKEKPTLEFQQGI